MPDVIDVELVKTQAVLLGLKYATECQLQYIIYELDCQSLVYRLYSAVKGSSPHELLCDDVRPLASKFASISFSYIRRTGNCVAHFLAQFSLQRKENFFLLEVVPQTCTNCLLKDSPSSV